MKKLKLFGERNSGTNYLDKLIHLNLEAEVLKGVVPNLKFFTLFEFSKTIYFKYTAKNNLGWKHAKVNVEALKAYNHFEKVCFVTITKNPYTFLLSLMKKPYHRKGDKPKSFLEFLESNWHLTKRENISKSFVKNPIELWNMKNGSYKKLKEVYPNKTLNIKYEALLKDPKIVIDEIGRFFNLQMKQDFVNYTSSTKPTSKTFGDYQKYYLQEEWKEDLSQEEITLINQHLDDAVVQFFKYQKLEQ